MDPGEQPEELKKLSYIEEQLIAQIHPVISVYRIKGNQFGYSGQVINFPQDISTFSHRILLPHSIKDIANIIVVRKQCLNGYKDFIVKRKNIESALKWLIDNNKWYKHVKIDFKNLEQLPENEDVYSQILKNQNDEIQPDDSDLKEMDFEDFLHVISI